MSDIITFFGGTFDPIHNGHLQTSTELAEELNLQQLFLLPNHIPPHRPQPVATPSQRVAMLERAIIDRPLFAIDQRELERDTDSWTIETLEGLREQHGSEQPIGLIIGQDSLLTLSTWHRWHELIELCHLLVCKRPGYDVLMPTSELQTWLEEYVTAEHDLIHSLPAGKVWLANTSLHAISATEIRQRIRDGLSCDDLLPAEVLNYIQQQGLYRN